MLIVRQFINHASTEGLASYFSTHDGFKGVDWSQHHAQVAVEVISLFVHQPHDVQTRIQGDLERIKHMSDELGQAAMLSTCLDPGELWADKSAAERSLSLFKTDPNKFRQAEDIRYADHYRHGQKWSVYQVGKALPLHKDSIAIETFKSTITSLFGLGRKVKIEFFDRTQPDEAGNDILVVQVMVYQEGLPDSYLEFKGDEDIAPRIRRPVSEHAIIYDSGTGTIEVVAATQERRDTIAKAFTENLLKLTLTAGRVPLRRFDLKPLMNQQVLDWDVADQIESVQLIMLKLQDVNHQGRVMIEVPAKSDTGLYEYCNEHFGECNPVGSKTFNPIQAIIIIRFQPERDSHRGKVLPVKISLPNGCDLRSRTERERLIGEKYLKRWGLVKNLDA